MSAIVRAFSVERVREELRTRGIVFSEGLNDVLVADFPVLDHDEHNRHAPSRSAPCSAPRARPAPSLRCGCIRASCSAPTTGLGCSGW